MGKDHFTNICQNCGNELSVSRLSCKNCGVSVEGNIELPRLARLSPEAREFIELFLLSAGSLKEVGKILKLSYPTVRAKLDGIIADLKKLDEDCRTKRMSVIHRLEKGEISAEDAARLLARMN